jgi:hypothetical protein
MISVVVFIRNKISPRRRVEVSILIGEVGVFAAISFIFSIKACSLTSITISNMIDRQIDNK